MKKIYIIIPILFMLCKIGFSQNLKLYIDSVEVSNVVYNIEQNDYIDDGKREGPAILFYCRLKNIDTSTCIIHPSMANFRYSFYLENELYSDEFYPLVFGDLSIINIEPEENVSFAFDILVFFGTPMHNINKTKFDYTIEMMKILPTLVIYYKENNRFLIESGRIKKVKVLN